LNEIHEQFTIRRSPLDTDIPDTSKWIVELIQPLSETISPETEEIDALGSFAVRPSFNALARSSADKPESGVLVLGIEVMF
jgi:hypothetical protein